MHQLINKFCIASGELINTAKSFMIVSPTAQEEHRNLPHDIFSMKIEPSFGKYLKVSMTFTMYKKCEFNFLVKKIQRKLQRWKTKLLFLPGRLLLINNVLGAFMSTCFLCISSPDKYLSQNLLYDYDFGGGDKVAR